MEKKSIDTTSNLIYNRGSTHDRDDPLGVQIGGQHYKDLKIQPVEFTQANNLSFLEGCIVKRISRHASKNGAEDIRKIKHECDLILKLVYGEE